MSIFSKYLVVIAGPTAAGKTELAIELAERFNTVILSADSRQFYKEMNIGTAKPEAEQLSRIKHYFINTKSVDELYGAGNYEKDALKLLDELYKEKDIIFLVGGSGLYLNALIHGIDEFVEVPVKIRSDLNKEFKEKGLKWLQEELSAKDEIYYNQVDLNNPQRIIRALEVCNYTGKPYSSFLQKSNTPRSFKVIPFLVTPSREVLYKRINDRVDEMMNKGLLNEVKLLKEHRHQNALKTVGYKELIAYLEGEYDLKTGIEKIKQHTRNYAKRQLTWFRNRGNYIELDSQNFDAILATILKILRNDCQ